MTDAKALMLKAADHDLETQRTLERRAQVGRLHDLRACSAEG